MSRWLGVTLGDPSGVGPEVALKALKALPASADEFKYLLLGDANLISRLNETIGLSLQQFKTPSSEGRFFFQHIGPNLPDPLPCGSSIAAQSAMAALTAGAERALAGELTGIVTAPVNKESIIRLGRPFTGQTEYLSALAKTDRTAMMLLGADDRDRWLRVALVTTHLPLRNVADHITESKIVQTIELAAQACRDLA